MTEFVACDLNHCQIPQKILELPDSTELCTNNLQFTFVINMIVENGYIGREFLLRDEDY